MMNFIIMIMLIMKIRVVIMIVITAIIMILIIKIQVTICRFSNTCLFTTGEKGFLSFHLILRMTRFVGLSGAADRGRTG